MAKIFIATPMYGGVCHGVFLKGMLDLTRRLQENKHVVFFSDLYNESLITRARNTLTEMFLRTDFDYLLFIDADQGFDASAVVKMIEEGVDLVGAAVPMKGINWDRVRKAAKEDREKLENFTAIYNVNMNQKQKEKLKENPNILTEVDYMGTGLMLASRKVFETIKKDVRQYRSDQPFIGGIYAGEPIYDFWQTVVNPESDRLLSEDYQFCQLWKNAGGKIYLAPYVKVVHVGTYWFK
jgi:hypothetical protein